MLITDLIHELKQKLDNVVVCSEKDIHGREILQTRIKTDYPEDPYDRETVFRIETY